MTTLFTKSVLRSIAVFLTVVIFSQFIVPLSLYALTSGPTQPEFSSFEPVATTNMVNEFTGAFTYNLPVIEIPGPHGSSYPLSLSYHSGATPEEEASWVGYGWNINPGAVNRGVRGYPDDDMGVKIEKRMNAGVDITASIGVRVSPEVVSTKVASLGGNVSFRCNSNKGFGYGIGIDVNFAGYASVGFNVEDGNSNFTTSVDPWKCLNVDGQLNNSGVAKSKLGQVVLRETTKAVISSAFSYASDLMTSPSYSTPMQEFTGVNVVARIGSTGDALPAPFAPLGPNGGASGTFSSFVAHDRQLSAYGYMYSGIAQTQRLLQEYGEDRNEGAVSMDYYKERYAPYHAHQKYLPIPFNNPDDFAVTGEGIGGNFRFHHREIGTNIPERSSSKKPELGMAIEYTVGTKWGISPSVNLGYTNLRIKPGTENDNIVDNSSLNDGTGPYTIMPSFNKYSTDAEFRDFEIPSASKEKLNRKDDGVFPRFTGDLGGSVVFDQNMGTLSSPTYDKVHAPDNLNSMNVMNSSNRSGRSSHIAYNTIGTMKKFPDLCYTKDEETRSKILLSDPQGGYFSTEDYDDQVQNYLPDNAIGEFAVYLPDGRCYIYGLPVLARNEDKVSYLEHDFSMSTGESRHAPYATKYLLTQILTPDYIDIDGNGPTDNDLGGWIKFTYKRGKITKQGKEETWAKWRMPFREDTYQHAWNKLFDANDDTRTLAQGEKQMYILEKVETASHVAYFVTNRTNTTYHPSMSETVDIQGSGIERADAYQSKYGNGLIMASDTKKNENNSSYFGVWDPSWPNQSINSGEWKHVVGTNEFYASEFQISNTDVVGENVTITSPRLYPNFSENLERIELYKKGDPQLIKTVRFEYDYSTYAVSNTTGPIDCDTWRASNPMVETMGEDGLLHRRWDPCEETLNAQMTYYALPLGMPNSAMYPMRKDVNPLHSQAMQLGRYGKLTLKKVWFEYGGILNAKISPYIFEYSYPSTTISDNDLQAKYPNYLSYGSSLYTPVYVDIAQDAWGYYSDNPLALRDRNFHNFGWLSQKNNNFDPAPYHLKVIKLPSGGEIRVQYEGHDYSYVQNRPAMAMVSLKKVINACGSSNNDCLQRKYYLETNDIPGYAEIMNEDNGKDKLVEMLRQQFIGEKIAFKFLCSFNSTEELSPDEADFGKIASPPRVIYKRSQREYVNGYCDVNNIGKEGPGPDEGKIYIVLEEKTSPIKIAKEYYTTNISGNDNSLKSGNILETIKSLPGKISLFNSEPGIIVFNKFSYFRLPTLSAKKAGGCRVKRVLMYHSGDQSESNNEGGAVLYGQEYFYKTIDERTQKVTSSGVATNEPYEMRIENPLVNFLEDYTDPGWLFKPIAGKYLDNYEGPLGESILPAASIGYSKVIVRNIHTGKTSPGFSVHDFFTCKDKPFLTDDPQFTTMTSRQTQFPIHAPLPFLNINIFGESKSQGYCFSINSMHGQPKQTSQYGWNIQSDPSAEDFFTMEKSTCLETVKYDYFEPKELLPLFYDESTLITNSLNGVEIEVSHEANSFSEVRNSLDVELDYGLGLTGAPPPGAFAWYLSGGMGTIGIGNIKLECSAVSKIIRYPSVLKKITTIRDGMTHTVENVAFSPTTGQPVVRMVTDEFDGTKPVDASIITGTTVLYELPASSLEEYKTMGQKSENERFGLLSSYYNLSYSAPQNRKSESTLDVAHGWFITIIPNNYPPLYPGDILAFTDGDNKASSAVVIEANPLGQIAANRTYRIHPYGKNPITTTLPVGGKMVVIRSGKTNQLTAIRGSIALYGKTKEQVLSQTLSQLAVHGVLSASATKYSDNWNYSWSWNSTGEAIDSDTNDYALGRRGKWRPMESYIYRDSTIAGYGSTNKVYGNAGVTGYTNGAFTMFDWTGTPSSKWMKTSKVSHYSKHGEPVEEKDNNGIYSSAHFAHLDAVPSMIAKNSEYLNMYFESYEDKTGLGIIGTKGHTGVKSKELYGNATTVVLLPKVKNSGDYLIKLWSTFDKENVAPTIGGSSMDKVSRSGEWVLYEKIVQLGASAEPSISFNCTGQPLRHVDDIRIQPKEAQSTCYVYDNKNLRLLAQFDDQHFASIFQYNSEGKLTRKLKETTRGIKTLAETDYSTPALDRPVGKAGTGLAKYSSGETTQGESSASAVPSARTTTTSKVYLKNLLDKQKMNLSRDLMYSEPANRAVNMHLRNRRESVDTIPLLKMDLMNIHATPEQMNAKIIGVDTIKVLDSKKEKK